jgi:hypothetical protein
MYSHWDLLNDRHFIVEEHGDEYASLLQDELNELFQQSKSRTSYAQIAQRIRSTMPALRVAYLMSNRIRHQKHRDGNDYGKNKVTPIISGISRNFNTFLLKTQLFMYDLFFDSYRVFFVVVFIRFKKCISFINIRKTLFVRDIWLPSRRHFEV